MIHLSAGMLEQASAGILSALLVFLRVAAMVSVLPAFSERMLPMRVRLAAAFAFTLIVAPAIGGAEAPPALPDFARLALSETVIGLALGLGVRLFVMALQTAGAMAAQATSLSQLLGGAAAEPTPALAHVLVIAGLALAMLADLHVHAARLMIGSYDWFPVGIPPDPQPLSAWWVDRVAAMFALSFTLAVPFMIAATLYNLTLGVVNRAMPQLMVAFVGAPVITMGGLVLLLLCAPLMLSVWLDALVGFLVDPLDPAR
ncbi:flagellar biosynthetic protein FliR [Pukyongiella litopenaei]|nr:flagellar biosynthetic protein FliR [Pukyongiella litopenaei]